MSPNPNLVRPDRDTLLALITKLNDRDISRRYGCTSPVVARWRDGYGIPRSPRQCGGNTTKWQTDRDYFARIDSPEKAYILGFLIADGHIRREGYKLEVSVKESDADLLRRIAGELGCEAPLGTMINGLDGSRMARLCLCGQKLISDLNGLGLRHDKSVTAVYPAIPADLEGHLVRGLWDGDGYIGPGQFELIGTSAVLDGVVAAAERHTGCLLRRRIGGKEKGYHYAYGTRRDTAVMDWMYSGASIVLARKRAKFLQHWS